MHWVLKGTKYENDNGDQVPIREFPFIVSIGDTIEKFGSTVTVSNIFYMENGSVILETSSLSGV
jgi:hypothetical protein